MFLSYFNLNCKRLLEKKKTVNEFILKSDSSERISDECLNWVAVQAPGERNSSLSQTNLRANFLREFVDGTVCIAKGAIKDPTSDKKIILSCW